MEPSGGCSVFFFFLAAFAEILLRVTGGRETTQTLAEELLFSDSVIRVTMSWEKFPQGQPWQTKPPLYGAMAAAVCLPSGSHLF